MRRGLIYARENHHFYVKVLVCDETALRVVPRRWVVNEVRYLEHGGSVANSRYSEFRRWLRPHIRDADRAQYYGCMTRYG